MLRRVPARLLQLRQPRTHPFPQYAAVIFPRELATGPGKAGGNPKVPPIPECNMVPVGPRCPPGKGGKPDPCAPKPPSAPQKPPCKQKTSRSRCYILGALALLSGLGALYYFGALDDVLEWLGLGRLRRHGAGAWAKFPGLGQPRRRHARHRYPQTSEDLPDCVAYLLVGGGSAAIAAARAIRRCDKNAQVLIISAENAYPYQRTPLSKELWQTGAGACFVAPDGKMHSVFYEPESYYVDCKALAKGAKGVALARGWEVKKLNVREHKAVLHDGRQIQYERCLLVTGCSPFDLAILEKAKPDVKKKVQCMHDVCDFESLRAALHGGARDIVVVGGTQLACELAAALARHGRDLDLAGLRVNLVFPEETPHANVLPLYLGRWLARRLQAEGVRLVPKTQVRGTSHTETHAVLRLTNGECLPACRIVVAVATNPNTDIARTSGLKLDHKHGGFKANEELRADRDVWAAGDCASYCDARLGRTRSEGMDNALVSGALAGHNMVAASMTDQCKDMPSVKYEHMPVSWGSLCPGASYEAVGEVDASLPTVGVFAPLPQTGTGGRPPPPYNSCESCTNPEVESADYSHGAVFYLRDNIVVGVLLWNLYRRLGVARDIVDSEVHYDDLDDAVQQLCIHSPP